MKKILIIDDIRKYHTETPEFLLGKIFTNPGNKPSFSFAENYQSARDELKQNKFDIVMLDAHLGDLEEDEEFSYNLIPELKENNNAVIIVMCSSNEAWNEEGIKKGATTSINKAYISTPTLLREERIKEIKNILI